MKVDVKQEVSEERIADMLTTAFEGGSNYWCCITGFVKPKSLKFRIDKDKVFRHIDYPMNKGGVVIITDLYAECEKGNEPPMSGYRYNFNNWKPRTKPFRLTPVALKKGLQVMASRWPDHFADLIADNDDACTGDVFLQCCVFGDVIYG